MDTTLVAPLHLDLLFLEAEQSVARPLGEFYRLPYATPEGDVNSDLANLSEEIVAQPFQDSSFRLKPGVHLHWALPPAISRTLGGRILERRAFLEAFQNGEPLWDHLVSIGWIALIGSERASVFERPSGVLANPYKPLAGAIAQFLAAPRENDLAPAPNRWLVTRSGDAQADFQQWIVESDYLYPVDSGADSGAVDIPARSDDPDNAGRPFRFLGRKIPLALWNPAEAAARLRPFTSAGYGTPTFAAFYPNCHSVFGLHDPAPAERVIPGLRYDVTGWYSDPGDDYLSIYVGDFQNRYAEANAGRAPSVIEIYAAIDDDLGWSAPDDQSASAPAGCVLYGSVAIALGRTAARAVADASDVSVSIGNTGTEALAAFLAYQLDPERKALLEDQLESVQFASQFRNRRLDVGAKFKEARHDRGFRAVEGGQLWTLLPQSQPDQRADAQAAPPQQTTIDPALAAILSRANVLQGEYERLQREIDHLRHVTFADWYKYMICAYPPEDSRDAYPDIDEVKFFIEKEDLARLDRSVAAAGQLALSWGEEGLSSVSASDSAPKSAAARLAAALQELLAAVADHNRAAAAPGGESLARLSLRQSSAPRFWEPTEPVVLITGEQAAAAARHDPDFESACAVLGLQSLAVRDGAAANTLRDAIRGAASASLWSYAEQTWSMQHWHPLLLEWEVELFPLRQGGNLEEDSNNYAPSYLLDNYTLRPNECALSLKPGMGQTVKGANLYAGQSILAPQSSRAMQGALSSFLRHNVVDDYNAQADQSSQIVNTSDLQPAPLLQRDEVARLSTWYQQAYLKSADDQAKAEDGLFTAMRAYDALFDLKCQSQALSGFNDALLMHKQTFQLLVADPLGFPEYQRFTEAARDAVGFANRTAPEPQNDFNPIRSGALRLSALRLVDSFGRPSENLALGETLASEQLSNPDDVYPVFMAPRFSQPARLNFRFLAAADDEVEMNAHPATSPICGWLLPNLLDGSLMIYDAAGAALGSIYSIAAWNSDLARWDAVPGDTGLADPEEIVNVHLRAMVSRIRGLGKDFVSDFLAAIEASLDAIDPESHAQHEGLALLVGRPVALVRATLGAELQGPGAIHHGWGALRQDMQSRGRENNAFTSVRFPVRLGESGQLNDGLVGYWIEGAGEDDVFHAPQETLPASDHIRSGADPELLIPLSFDAEPVTVSMLVDPRGSVHATTGALPTKQISLPPDQYASALREIAVTFLAAPVLAQADALALPLSSEPGYAWSWVQRAAGAWSETPSTDIRPVNTQATFAPGQSLQEGWMKLSPASIDNP